MESTIPTAPFTNPEQLAEFLRTKFYGPMSECLPVILGFYGVTSLDELMAIPARTNSGALSTVGGAWFAMFPFVDMNDQTVDVDQIFLGDDGYTMMFWGRWSGSCTSACQLPNGESLDLTGKSFEGLRYAYRLRFDRETKKVVLFEGLFDVAEWGRLMGAPDLAVASARWPLYPT